MGLATSSPVRTNEPHGSVYYYGMDDGLASPSIPAAGADQLSQHQYGASSNFQKDRRSCRELRRPAPLESNQFSSVIRDNFAAINATRARYGLSLETLDQVRTSGYNTFMDKLDHNASDRLRLSLRYNFLDSEALRFPGGAGRASAASSAARDNHTRDHSAVLGATATFTPRLLGEMRLQWARRSYSFAPIVGEPTMEVTNLLIMGKTTSDPDFYKEDRWQGSGNLLYTRGDHRAKFGFDVSHVADEATWNLFFPARIIFPSLAAFTTLTPAVFWFPVLTDSPIYPGVSTTGPTGARAVPRRRPVRPGPLLGLFAQDEWTATEADLTTAALRPELPVVLRQKKDSNNVQPRLGFAYAFSPGSVLRGGAGLFSDRLASSVGQVFTAAEWSSRGDSPNAPILFPAVSPVPGRFRQTTVGGPGAPPAAAVFLATGRAPLTGATSLTDNVSGELDNPYSIQASLQYSHPMGPPTPVGELPVRQACDLLGHTATSTRCGTIAATGGHRGPPVPSSALHVTDNIGRSTHHGGRSSCAGPSPWHRLHGLHTLSHTMANVESITNLGDFPEYLDLDKEWSLSRQHVKHRGTFSFMSDVPKSVSVLGGLRFAALFTASSGRFFTVFVGADANGDGNPNADRVGTLGKNTLAGPGYMSLDTRLAKEFGLGHATAELSVDVFNLLNRANVRDLNTVWGHVDSNVPAIPSSNTPRATFPTAPGADRPARAVLTVTRSGGRATWRSRVSGGRILRRRIFNESSPRAARRGAVTVRDATFGVLRHFGLITIFSNPGSTEVPFLAGLPVDLRFVLALHESSAVGMATGWAIARGEPAFVLLHTTAGLGNAVSALATARVNRAPLVVVVGQQDRRHVALEPFLTGRLEGLGGDYPVWVSTPARAQDVPGAVARAWHEASTSRGPALVIVHMDDWLAPAGEEHELAAPVRLLRSSAADPAAVAESPPPLLARPPALVVGAGATIRRAGRRWSRSPSACPVWQESFGARAGFPQDHPLFAGHLPAGRARLRDTLGAHDFVLAVGAPVFRQYPYEPGPFVPAGTRLAIVTDDAAEAHRSPVQLAIVGPPAGVCRLLADRLPARTGRPVARRSPAPPHPSADGRLRAGDVLAALAERLPRDVVLVEECPSSRPELHRRIPARAPLGFLSAAMGGLGFALPAAIGVRMAVRTGRWSRWWDSSSSRHPGAVGAVQGGRIVRGPPIGTR